MVNAPHETVVDERITTSVACAYCHSEGPRVVGKQDQTFLEWREDFNKPGLGRQQCQDCHMPHRGATLPVRADKGGLTRDPKAVFSHLMPGAKDQSLLGGAAGLALDAHQSGASIHVTVTVSNDKAGHHIPTDHPSRNMLLIVSATDSGNQDLVALDGPVVPSWGGAGSAPEDYGGKPGRGFAKILEQLWTEVAPTAAYWSPTVLREDTRIPALGKDVSEYDFLAPAAGGAVRVAAKLVFRRAFRQLSNWKQ